MRNNLALMIVIVIFADLAGMGLAPLPAAAAPGLGYDPAALGALPAWFAGAPVLSGAEGSAVAVSSRVLPAWFFTSVQCPASSIQYPASSIQHPSPSPHHTIHENDVTVTGPDEVNNCDVVTFTVVAANDTVTTTNVIITSTMPAGFTPTQRVFIVGTVNPTQTITRTAAFTATCSAVSGQNVVVLTQGITETEPITRYTNFVVNPGAITLRKEPSVVQASIGDVVTWTVKVENTGYGIVSNVIATDTLGTGLRYHSGFTSTSYISIPVGQTRSFTVAAEIIACSGLDNNVEAAWGCSGETCQTRTAQANVDLVVRAPLLDYTPPNINVDYCAGQSTYTMTITNIGEGTAYTPSIAVNSDPLTVTSSSANYSGGAFHLPDDIPAGDDYVLTFTLSLPDPPCGMVGDSGVFLYRPTYYDECDNVFYPPVKSSNWTIGGSVPDLDVRKSGPSEVYANEIITYALNVTTQNISGTITITDTFRPHCAGYTPLNVAGGTVVSDASGNITITWATTDTNWTADVSFQPNTTCPTMCACCGVLASNYLTATVKDCQDCFVSDEHRYDNGRTTSIQCEEILNSHAKGVTPSSDESCTTRTYTSTYVFGSSFIYTPTWQGMVYTDLLPHQNYITGSAWISISNGTQACTATFAVSDTAPLVIGNISPTCGISVAGATMHVFFQAVVDEADSSCYNTSFYDWSYLNIGVTGNNASCPECSDGIFEEGVWVGVSEPDMELTFSDTPPFVSSCGEYTFTMNLHRYSAPAYDVEAVFYTSTYRVMEVVGFTGHTPVLTTTDGTGYHWFYSDAFTTATTGQVTLRVQLACASTSNAPIRGSVYYDNNCTDDNSYNHTCSDTDWAYPTPQVLVPQPILYKSPETIYASDDVVTWTLTAINSGAGAAYGVTLTDTLGSDLRYSHSTITSTMGSAAGVTPLTSTNLVTWTGLTILPGEEYTIKYAAEVIGCHDLDNTFSGVQGCQGEICNSGIPQMSHVELPSTMMINSNNALTPLRECFTRTITATVRNAGLMSVYSATIAETLPQGMSYVANSTEYVVSTGATPPATGWVSGGEPSGTPAGPLVWTSTQITNLARLYPHETVWVRFNVRASCNFAGGNVTIQATYRDVCGDAHTSSASNFAMPSAPAEMTAHKRGRNLTTGSSWTSRVYAGPGETIQWDVDLINSSDTPALFVVVTDVLPSNTTFITATPIPDGVAGNVITWNVGTLGHTSWSALITTTVNAGGCTASDTSNGFTAVWGCDDGCREQTTAQATLRTRPRFYPSTTTGLPETTLHQCGGVLTATLNNAGPPARYVTLTDTLPSGFIYSATVGYSTAPSGTVDLGQTVVFTWATLPTGLTHVAFEVINSGGTGACQTPSGPNVITVAYNDADPCTSTGVYYATDSQPVNVAAPALEVHKLPRQQVSNVGEVISWTITVGNAGSGAAYNTIITDVLASNYVSASITATVGSDGSPPTIFTSTNTIVWTPDNLPTGGIDDHVYALAARDDGTVYVGGSFAAAGDTSLNHIARWNGASWSALGSGVNGLVHALAVDESGNVYAGGAFTVAGGTSATNHIAMWDGSNWSALGGGVSATVRAIAVYSNTVYAGGDFDMVGGVSANHIAAWNGSSWFTLTTGVSDTVRALAVYSDTVYAGGDFHMAGGVSANHIAMWDGSNWSAPGSGVSDTVRALAVFSETVYAGGDFHMAGGVSAGHIATWDGSSWSSLTTGVSDTVRALAVYTDGTVYAGGTFTMAGGISAHRIARWDGSNWSTLGSGLNDTAHALVVDSSENVYAGGEFGTAGGVTARYAAMWDGSSWSSLSSKWMATIRAEVTSGGSSRNTFTATTYCDTGCAATSASDTAYVSLLETFGKKPPIQTGTIGSLAVFTFTASLGGSVALYEDFTLTDTLPTGLGYVSSWLSFTHDMDDTSVWQTTSTPTITPGNLASGDVAWRLGDLSGTLRANGIVTAVIQDIPSNYEGISRTNTLTMTYVDDTMPYSHTDTTDVDILEPLLHIGKTYVTPERCEATLFQDNFNAGNDSGWAGDSGWSVVDGVYRSPSGPWASSRYAGDTSWTDYSFSAMAHPLADEGFGLDFRRDGDSWYRLLWNNIEWQNEFRPVSHTLVVRNEDTDTAYNMLVTDVLPANWTYVTSTITSATPPTITFTYEPPLSATGTITWLVNELWGTDLNGGNPGVATVIVSAREAYSVPVSLPRLRLQRNGEDLTQSSRSYDVGHWYHVEIRTEKNLLRLYVNGELTLSYTDTFTSALTAGQIGLYQPLSSTVEFDDVLVTRLDEMACFVAANDPVTYTIVVSSQARIPSYDLVITDAIPAGMSLYTFTVTSDDPGLTKLPPWPVPGETGDLVWNFDQLAATSPFSPLHHTALTLTVVLTVSDEITSNVVLPNQVSLAYGSQSGPGPAGVERDYSGGSHSTAVRTVSDSGIVKALQFTPPPTATLGTLVVYTLTLPTDSITATLHNVIVTDTIDSRLYIEGVDTSSGTGVSSGFVRSTGLVTVTFASIPHDTQATITVTTRISHEWPSAAGDANDGETISNTAQMRHSTAPLTTTNEVSATVGEPEVAISKSVESSTGALTDLDGTALLTYTLRLTNTGTSPAYSVHITDAVPSGISVTAQFGGDFCSGPVVGPTPLTWTVDTISNTAPANVAVLTYTARISRATSDAWLTNTADLLYHSLTDTIPGVRPYTGSASASVETAQPTIAKASEPLTLRVGDIVTYHLVFTIPAGTVGLSGNSYLSDTLPWGVWYITDSETLDWTPAAVGVTFTGRTSGTLGGSQVVTWTFGQPITSLLDLPTVVTLTFRAQAVGLRISDGVTVCTTHTAVCPRTNSAGLCQRGTFIGTDDASNQVIQPRLNITKDSTPPPGSYVGAGERLTYTLTITNDGHGPAYDTVVSDTLPSGLAYVTSTVASTAPSTITFDVSPAVGSTGVVTWRVNELWGSDWNGGQPGVATITVTIHVTDTVGANRILTNTAAIPYYDSQPGDGPGPYDPDERTYSDGSDSIRHHTINAGIAKDVTFSPPPTATLGTLVTYTFAVPDQPISATLYNVLVTDTVNSRLYIEHVDTGGGTGVSSGWSGQVVTAAFASIPHSTQAYVTVTACISHTWPDADNDADSGHVITDVAQMTHSTAPLASSNEVSTTVGEPDVEISKRVESSTGDLTDLDGTALLTYTLRLTNTGSSPAYSLHITDALPSGISVTAQFGGDFRSGPVVEPGVMTWTVGYISNTAPVNVVVLTYTARISNAVTGAHLTNTVDILYHSLTETIPGVRPYTDTDSAVVVIAGLTTDKSWSPTTLRFGDLTTVTITTTVPVSTVAYYPRVVDILPHGYVCVTETFTHSLNVRRNTITDALGGNLSIVGNPEVWYPPAAYFDDWFGPDNQMVDAYYQTITGTQDAPFVFTETFQVQLTGVGRPPTYTAYYTPPTVAQSSWTTNNVAHAHWNRVDDGRYDDLNGDDARTPDVTVAGENIQPVLDIAKDSDPSPGSYVAGGDTITYTLTITNDGHGPAYDIVITDTLPVDIDHVRTISAPNPSTAVITPVVNGRWITYTVSELVAGPGETMAITVVARVSATIGANLVLTNTAAIPYYDSQPNDGPGPYDPDEREYTDGDDSVLHRTVDARLQMAKAVTPDYATLGDVVTYTIRVPNPTIAVALYGVTVTDQLEGRLRLRTVVTDGVAGDLMVAGNSFTVTYGVIISSAQRIITVTAVPSSPLNATAGDVITNVVVLEHRDGGPIISNEPPFTVTEPALTPDKSSDPPAGSPVGANQTVTYTVRLTNDSGPIASDAYDIVITDTLPFGMRDIEPSVVGLTIEGADVAGYTESYAAPDFIVTLPTTAAIPPGGTLLLTYTARADNDLPAGIDLTNRISATWSSLPGDVPGDRDYPPVTDTNTLTTPQAAGLIKNVTFSPPPTATLGTLVTYTLVVPTDPITATLYSVIVTDTIDSRLYIEDVRTGGGTGVSSGWSGQVVTATFASIPHDTQAYVTVTARISDGLGADAGHVITDVAQMSHSTAPVTTTNQVSTTVGEPVVSILKVSDPPTSSTVDAGDFVTYTARFTNSSGVNGSPAYDLVFTDTLPEGMRNGAPTLITVTLNGTPVSAYTTGYNAGVFTVTFTPAFSIPVGGVLLIQYVTTVDADAPAATDLTNQAEIIWSSLPGPVPGDRDYGPITDTTTVHTPLAVGLSKSVAPPVATIDAQVVFALAVPAPAIGAFLHNVVFTDVIDSRLRIDGVSPNGSYSGQVVTASFTTIPTHTQEIIVITATVRDLITVTNGTQITNVAAFDYRDNPAGPVGSNVVTVTVVEPRVTLDKSAQTPRDPLGAGDLVTYTLALSNTGTWPAYDLVITDSLPAGVAFDTLQAFTVTDPTTATLDGDYPAWTVSQLNVDGFITITFTARVSETIGAGLTLVNGAWGTYDNWPGDLPYQRDYTIPTDTVPLQTGYPALDLEKSATPDLVEAGDYLTYTLIVTNSGIVSATGIVIPDLVPVNTNYQSCGPAPCGHASGLVSWTLGTLDIGLPHTVTLVVQVTSPLPNGTLITNTAWVTSTEGISDSDEITTPVSSAPILRLVKASADGNGGGLRPGDRLTYTLVVSNTGNANGTNVVISDTVPAHTTYVPGSIAGGDSRDDSGLPWLTWTVNLLPLNTPLALTFAVTVNVPLTNSRPIYNGAFVTCTQGVSDTAGITDTVTSSHVLAVTKSAAPSPVQAGSLLTYTIAYTITGDEPVYGVVVSDTTPAHTTFYTATPPAGGHPGVGNAGLVFWQLGDFLPPESGLTQASGALTLVVQVDSPILSGTLLHNVVAISDTSGLADSDEITTPVESAHSLSVSKSASSSPVAAGSLLTYTVAWAVAGNEPAFDVTISDTVPQNTAYQSCGPSPCSQANGLVTWSLGHVNPPASGLITMVVQVNSPLISGTPLYNAVSLTDTSGLTDTDQITTPVESSHQLSVRKTAQPDPVAAGALLTYTIVYTITGNEPVYGVVVSDTTPANTTFYTAAQPTASAPGVGNAGAVVWQLGDFLPPESGITQTTGVLIMVVLVDSPLLSGTLIHNVVAITDSSGLTGAHEITTAVRWADVAVSKAVTPPVVASGQRVTFTLAYTNVGLVSAENAIITDTLPFGLSYLSAVPSPTGVSGQTITWSLGTLGVGTSGSIQLVATVDATSTTYAVFTNTVVITTTTPETNTTNNDNDATTVFTQTCDVSIVKLAQPPTVVSGDRITYTLTYANAGPADAERVVITDVLPSGLTFAGCDPTTCGVAGQVITWSLGPVQAGVSGVLTLHATVDMTAALSAIFTNTVVVTTTTDDRDSSNDDDDTTTPLTQMIELQVIKWADPTTAVNGQTLTYTIRLVNTGDVPLSPVRLEDRLPPGFLYNDHARVYPPPGGAPLEADSVAQPTLIWNDVTSGAGLPAGGSVTLTFQVTVASAVTGTFVNVVTVTGTTPAGPITDADDAPIFVTDPAIVLDKQLVAFDDDEVYPSYITFTIAITNVGPSIIDVLPLQDQYDPYYLGFVDATLYPDTQDSGAGILTWYDLTAPPPDGVDGFGRDLPPGEAFFITTVFSVAHTIDVTTTNVATTAGATDVYDNNANDDMDAVVITDTIPTAVELLYFQIGAVSGREVQLEWATAVEIDNFGFNVYRAPVADRSLAGLVAFVPSQAHSGGATYVYTDTVSADGLWWYWLADVDTSGYETFHGPVIAEVGANIWSHWVYLPLVLRYKE